MSVLPGDILRDTEPTAVSGIAGRFSALIPEAWRIFYAFGGATMATALRVAEMALEREDLHLVSSEAMFCQAIPVGPVAASAEILRQGKTAAQVLVRLWALDPQSPDPSAAERSDLMVMCVFGLSEESPFEFVGALAPDVPDPDDCPQPPPRPDDSPFNNIAYHEQTEFRFCNSHIKWNEEFPAGKPESASWFRFKVPPLRSDGSWHPASLALPGDILGPAVHAGAGGSVPPFLVISLQLGLQIVNEVRGEWLLQHTKSQVAGSGYASGTAELYDQDRRLVAVATQCAKIQPIKLG